MREMEVDCKSPLVLLWDRVKLHACALCCL